MIVADNALAVPACCAVFGNVHGAGRANLLKQNMGGMAALESPVRGRCTGTYGEHLRVYGPDTLAPVPGKGL